MSHFPLLGAVVELEDDVHALTKRMSPAIGARRRAPRALSRSFVCNRWDIAPTCTSGCTSACVVGANATADGHPLPRRNS
jgi:hypothetical protein